MKERAKVSKNTAVLPMETKTNFWFTKNQENIGFYGNYAYFYV